MNNALEPAIKYSIGVEYVGSADGQLNCPKGLAFDRTRGRLYVSDNYNHRVQVFSSDDGSLIGKFGSLGGDLGQCQRPWNLAIDYDNERIFVSEYANHRVQAWSLNDHSPLLTIGHRGSNPLEFLLPRGVAIDEHRRRIIIVDTANHRLQVLSLLDLSFLFSIGGHSQSNRPREFNLPSNVVVDRDRHRIIVSDTGNNRVQVLSSTDGSFLFEFGCEGKGPGQFFFPYGLCIDNADRIIVSDTNNRRLQAFTHEGQYISSFDCGTPSPAGVAFEHDRGLIAFLAGHRVHVIGANQWLPNTFVWMPYRHRYAPSSIKQAVETVTMIRSLVHESALSMVPNELLFEIFAYL